MNIMSCTFALVALIPTAFALGIGGEETPFKCLDAQGPPVYILDGRVVPAVDNDSRTIDGRVVDYMDIESVSVQCSVEADRVYGVEPRRNLVVIRTNAVPPQKVTASVQSLVTLQDAYFVRRGAYAARLEDLSWSDSTGSITVRLCVSDDGRRWNALGWQASPNDKLPRVLVSGATGSVAVDPRYSCQAVPDGSL